MAEQLNKNCKYYGVALLVTVLLRNLSTATQEN